MTAPSSLPKRKLQWRKWALSAFMVVGLIWSAWITQAHMGMFFQNIGQFTVIFQEMAHVDWSYTYYTVDPMIQTLKMSIIGTLIGSALAFPYALLVSRNIVTNKVVVGIFRFILNIVRTIPDLMLAALFVAVVGIGPIAGIFALAIFTFGMVGKLFYEAIETIDPGPLEALRAAGAGRIEIIRFAVVPQIANYFISYVLYAFEINVRASTVLGYMGAGGIGIYLQQALSMFRYDRVGLIVLVIFAVVLVIDYISGKAREALL
ncbi:phosphonate ABC transporter, permease protein PhnE [Lacticaseibacillus jixianensis]|uniref:Phosphonate ABC transporter, permease protein PhnE n=1 Tax=Lacticaseibacillus jixianensis TaxID=2486012 RepID=A0ABW4BD58_9LACO|nr:phosphonate ABC transporter, permease protein PhnE [Lacticaseibacillus jixianensis]